MAKNGVTIQGLPRLTTLLRGAGVAATKALSAALYQQGLAIMSESQREVPVDTGVLRASGRVAQPRVEGSRVTVELGYGGAASAYAWPQHERTDYAHTVGKAKYLLDPLTRHIESIPRTVADRIESELTKGA
jgi:hypothetical protein